MYRAQLLPPLAAVWLLMTMVVTAELAVHRLSLDPHVCMYWVVDDSAGELEVEVTADLADGEWLAVGFSGDGGLPGADLCVLWEDWRRNRHVQHAWADGETRLSVDGEGACWGAQLTGSRGNLTGFRYRRPLNTCRPRDYVIEWGTTHVVWARGSGPLLNLQRLQLAGFPAGFARVQLLPPLPQETPLPADVRHLSLTSRNVTVPATETTYWCTVHRLPETFARKHHIVRYDAVIEPGSEALVHHMEVFHCEVPPEQALPEYQGPCHDSHRPPAVDACKRVLAAWAMGAAPLSYPQEAGLPIGGKDFSLFVMLEVHYNNPKKHAGHVDSSGVRLTYTDRLRRHDAAVMELGLEYTDKMAVPPGQTEFELAGYCVPECTAVGLPLEGIRVFASQLHTHLSGVAVRTQHVRSDGTELPDLNGDPHYSSHFQQIRRLPRMRRVLPGDTLITRCTYRTSDRRNVTLGGFAISDEMCVNYIHYFPKVKLEVCKSSVDSGALRKYFRFMRKWEDQTTDKDLGWGDNYRHIQWNKLRAYGLNKLYQTAPLSMQCNQSNGERFAGYWESIPLPVVLTPLPHHDHCLKQH